MCAYVRSVKGLAFSGMTDSGHWLMMDTKEGVGGLEGAVAPMEMFLQAIMGCTGMDVVSLLKKMKVHYTSFEIHEEHEKAQEHPKVFTRIGLTYRLEGDDIDPEKVKKAVRLSMVRYCSVTAMAKATVDMSWKIEINGEAVQTS
ncbi:MAG: OsmC family protein [Thermoplasmata archaeon]|nr:OsmC family protein [Thermoplasmata archaeon]